MSLVVQCTGCRKKLRVNHSAPGKVFKCPGCGTKLAVPLVAPSEPAVLAVRQEGTPARTPSNSNESEPSRPRKRRRRRRRPLKWLFQPLVEVRNVNVTPARLGVFAAILAAVSWFIYSRDFFGEPKVSVSVVQVFGWRNNVPVSDSNRLSDMQKAMAIKLQRKTIVVTAPDPQGEHLLVKFTLSGKVLQQAFGNKMMAAHIDSQDLVLQAGDKKLRPVIFLTDQLLDRGVLLHYPPPPTPKPPPSATDPSPPAKNPPPPAKDPRPAKNPPPPATKQRSGMPAQMEPPPMEQLIAPWGKNNGVLTPQPDGGWQFRGAGAMAIDCQVTGAPDYTIHVAWDEKSTGWVGDSWADSPIQLGWDWELTCVFPKPATTGDISLLLLGRPIPLRWR